MLRIVGILLLSLQSFVRHDFHTSLAEMSYNTQSKSLEISLRVFTDDFETTLSHFNDKKAIKLETEDPGTDQLIEKYLRKNLALVSSNKEVKFGQYLGKETEGDATWVYLEIKESENLKDFTIYNAIMQEMFTDQTNIINIKSLGKKKTLVFSANTKTVAWPF